MHFQRLLDSMSRNQSENDFNNITQSLLIVVAGNHPLLKDLQGAEHLFRHHCKWRQCIYFIAMVTGSSLKYRNMVHTGKKKKDMKENKLYTAIEMQREDQPNRPHSLRNN